MDLSQIIIKPYHTEKTYGLRQNNKEVITFIVARTATKLNVAIAFESIYGIKPEKINIVNRKPVATRTGTAKPGWTKAKKIAYITLPEGISVALTQEEMDIAAQTTGEAKETAANETPVSNLKEISE